MDSDDKLTDCYADCAGLQTATFDRTYAGWTLVQGRPTLQRAPFVKYGHAWLERGDWVYDPTARTGVIVSAYYRVGKIDPDVDCFRYTRMETRAMLTEYGHWGPWEGIEGCPPMGDD